MKTSSKLLTPLLAGALALGACDDLGTSSSDDARLSILLTDAPGDLRSAVVTITDVYLQPGEGEDAQRVYLRQGAGVTTDLLTLSNDVLELVDDATVPAGRYEQMRFVITGAYIEVEDSDGGTTLYATSADYEGLPAGAEVDGTLRCPSCAQSGFKVLLGMDADEVDDGEVVLDGEQTLLVDFDVSQSFGHQAGNSGQWIMRPTLKATSVQSAASLRVSLSKVGDWALPVVDGVELGLADLIDVTLTPVAEGSEAKRLDLEPTATDGEYAASFVYLFPGEYRVGFALEDDLSEEVLASLGALTDAISQFSSPVTLGEGQTAELDFQLSGEGPVLP